MLQQQTEHMPLVRDFGDIQLKKKSDSPRYIIEALLSDPKCFAKVKPFMVDGGVCGHKVMDLKGAVDVIKTIDQKSGGDGVKLSNFPLNDFQLGNALKTVLRSRYELDGRWKIRGENTKRALPAPVVEAEQETK